MRVLDSATKLLSGPAHCLRAECCDDLSLSGGIAGCYVAQALGDQSAERARFDVGGERQELVLPKQMSKGGVRCMHICAHPHCH